MSRRRKRSPPSAPTFVDRWRRIAVVAWRGWNDDQAQIWSAAIAFYSLFSLAPILLIATTLAGVVYGESAVTGRLQEQLRGFMGQAGAEFAAELVRRVQIHQGGWWPTLTGLALIVYGSTIAVSTLQQAFDIIWRAHGPGASGALSWIRRRALGVAVALFVGLLLLASVIAGTVLSTATTWADRWTDVPASTRVAGDAIVTLTLAVALFAVLFRYLPSIRPGWRDVWPGALITGALFALGRVGLSLYLSHAAVASTYGAAGTLVVVLLWIYYSAQILLVGAEITSARMQVDRGVTLPAAAGARRVS